MTNTIEARLQASGLRMTGPRRTIARVLAETHDHPDVEELHRRVQRIDPKISLSTVYRTVARLEAEGILERHAFRDGRSRYEPGGRQHHDHFIDARTGRIIEFNSPEIEALQAEIARKHGFKIVDHRLDIYVVPIDEPVPEAFAGPKGD